MKNAISAENEPRKGVQSIEHGTGLLDALARAGKGLPLKKLAQEAGMTSSTAHRYLASFIRTGLVRQDAVTGTYDLGDMALRLGLAAMQRLDSITVASEAAQTLTEKLDQTTLVAVWTEHGPVNIRWHHGMRPIFTIVGLGARLPVIQSAPGRVFAAYMPDRTTASLVDEELKLAISPPYTLEEFQEEVEQVKQAGFAISDGRVTPGLRTATVPVFNFQGQIVAAISLLSTSHALIQLPNRDVDELVFAAQQASARLGFDGKGV